MRDLIISDIHANFDALEAVLQDAAGRYDRIICLGDIVGYGPDPNRVVDWVRQLDRWQRFTLLKLLTGELRMAVGIDRRRRRALVARLMARAIEHVVGRIVDEQRARAARRLGQHAGRHAVDRHRQLALVLGAIDRRISRGVDDDLRRQLAHERGKARGLGQIGTVAPAGNDFAERLQAVLRLLVSHSRLFQTQMR